MESPAAVIVAALLSCLSCLSCRSWLGSGLRAGEPAAASEEKQDRAAAPAPAKRIPVILDTDIGDDIDDTWALVFLLRSPELDLKLVTTDHGDTRYRAKIAARILETAGRTDVPVGIGVRTGGAEGPQAPWVKGYDLAKYPGKVHEDGVGTLIDLVLKSSEPITLLCTGPVPNIAAALEREPRIAERARFVGMHGSVRRGYGGKAEPDPEYNVKENAAACGRALRRTGSAGRLASPASCAWPSGSLWKAIRRLSASWSIPAWSLSLGRGRHEREGTRGQAQSAPAGNPPGLRREESQASAKRRVLV